MSTPDADDRREYYRIEDRLALEFRPIPEDAEQAAQALQDDSPLFNLLGDLHLLEVEAQHLLRQIAERDRPLASYLKLLDKRLDLVAGALARGLLEQVGPAQPVVLSEGGIAFLAPEPLLAGQLLALKLVLLPQALGLSLRARVTHCESRGLGEYEIGTLFENLEEPQRQLLARHILQKQAAERRQAKDRDDS
ncbi:MULTISPECIES: PilZ domain-containing protein [Pseudomonas]|uniref:PilZ domain-containing protein n=1 Tax=Pseudomonas TaxID=286 RepID=UPI000D6EE203|nr:MULTISPECIES: PilZ domain-containing protein [unclassified Pseudomonas]MED5608189.1 PilZ domain-containing protein [Pseudomonas sp. JH-2]PWU26849.1 pilus assembly protein PilZ [Pseudomonas sp. RW407]